MVKQTLLILEHVTKKYKISPNSYQIVLDDINLSINTDECVILMGPSGSGKSTLLNIIAGLEAPSSGIVRFKDIDLTNSNDDDRTIVRKQEMGIIFQFFELLDGLTVLETLETTALICDCFDEHTKERLVELLKMLGLSTKEDQVIDNLSRGEKQRVAIARALINSPSLIIADEPTGSLDPETAIKTIELLREIARNAQKSLIISTHDFNILNHDDRIIFLDNGGIKLDKKGIKSISELKSTLFHDL